LDFPNLTEEPLLSLKGDPTPKQTSPNVRTDAAGRERFAELIVVQFRITETV
jgi:hypothetical protein